MLPPAVPPEAVELSPRAARLPQRENPKVDGDSTMSKLIITKIGWAIKWVLT